MNFWKVLSDIINIAREIDIENPKQLDKLTPHAQRLKDVLNEKMNKIKGNHAKTENHREN